MREAGRRQARSQGFPEEEARLVRGLREGEAAAHAQLCARFGPKLHAFAAARLAGDDQAAEEAMVGALVDAVRNIRRFDPARATFAAWLYGIAQRKIRGQLRRLKQLKSVPTSAQVAVESLSGLPDGEDMASNVAGRLDAQRRLSELAGALSSIEFEALVLHSVDELSAREIGHVLGRSERAIHSILHRARQKARERLARDEQGPG